MREKNTYNFLFSIITIFTIANVDVDSVGVIGRVKDEVGEPFVVDGGISSRSVVESFSALADDDGDNCPTEDMGERRI